jgi:cytochrome c oxidase subunit 2
MQKLYGWGLPVDISVDGWQIDRLIWIIHIFMAVLFIGWFAFFIYLIIRFRQRPGHKAENVHHHFKLPTYLEVGVALFEVFLLAAFSIPLFYHTRKAFPDPAKSLNVRIVAEQFAWNVHYPGKDGVFGKTDPKLMNPSNPVGLDPDDPAGKDDITTINQFHIPVNTPVIVTLSSKDVIHSFFLPVMRVKQDAIPGHAVQQTFEAKQTGNFEIACAQLCGLGHYRMRGYFIVDEKPAFDAWFESEIANKAGTTTS